MRNIVTQQILRKNQSGFFEQSFFRNLDIREPCQRICAIFARNFKGNFMGKGRFLSLLAAVYAMFCLNSCSGILPMGEKLDMAETLMNEHPDSALYILQNIDYESLKGKEEKARHSLLMSMALDKNYIDLTSDSLINIAVDYYDRHRDYERTFLSLYYQGRIYENVGEYNKAILSFTKAEDIEEEVGDDFAKGLLYAHLGEIYKKYYDYPKALAAFVKAEDYYKEAQRLNHQYNVKLLIAGVYVNSNMDDQAINLIKHVMEWSEANGNSRIYGHCVYMLNFMDINSGSGLECSLADVDINFDLLDNVSRQYLMAYDAAENNNRELALEKLNSAWNMAEGSRDSVFMYYYGYKIHKSLGNFEHALVEHEKLFNTQDKITRDALHQPLLTIQRDYFQSQAENNELRLKNGRIAFASWTIIAVLAILLIIVYYRHIIVEKQRTLDDYIDLCKEFEGLLSDSNDEIKVKKNVIRDLFSSQYELLNQLCKICYESPGKLKEKDAVYIKVKNEIEGFQSDSKLLSDLEKFVDEYNDGVMRKLREGMPMFTKMDYRLLCFFYAGFSAKAISIFTGDTVNNIYVKKNRIKEKIKKEKPSDWQNLISF